MTAAKPLLIDCDPGQDDALAILLAWGSAAVDLRAIVTVGGNCSAAQGARNALGLAALVGRKLPIAMGLDREDAFAAQPRSHVHGPRGIEGFALPDGGEPDTGLDGVELILEHCRSTPGLVIAALGPLTSIAEAFRRDPAAFATVERIAIMGGSTLRGNRTPAAEFNIWVDPEAADAVFRSGLPLSLIGLNTTHQALIPDATIEALAAIGNVTGKAVAGLLRSYQARYKARYGFASPPAHDMLVLADLVDPGVITFQRSNVAIELAGSYTRGATVIDLFDVTGRPHNAEVAVGVDTERLWSLFVAAVARLP